MFAYCWWINNVSKSFGATHSGGEVSRLAECSQVVAAAAHRCLEGHNDTLEDYCTVTYSVIPTFKLRFVYFYQNIIVLFYNFFSFGVNVVGEGCVSRRGGRGKDECGAAPCLALPGPAPPAPRARPLWGVITAANKDNLGLALPSASAAPRASPPSDGRNET